MAAGRAGTVIVVVHWSVAPGPLCAVAENVITVCAPTGGRGRHRDRHRHASRARERDRTVPPGRRAQPPLRVGYRVLTSSANVPAVVDAELHDGGVAGLHGLIRGADHVRRRTASRDVAIDTRPTGDGLR